MQTFKTDNLIFQYNEDFSGEIVITNNTPSDGRQLLSKWTSIPAEDLLVFLAEAYVRPKMLSAIEQTPPLDLLLNQIAIEE